MTMIDCPPGGKLRELHSDKALDVIKAHFEDKNINRTVNTFDGYTRELLINCHIVVLKEKYAEIIQTHIFMNVSVINGNGAIGRNHIKKGDHFILQ